jgi:hypothetical protein
MLKSVTCALATVVAAAFSLSGGALALDTFNLGGAAKGDPSAVWYRFAGDDYVAVFVRGPGDLMYANVGSESGDTWTGWAAIGTEALKGSPSCVATYPDQIDCFAVGASNAVRHITYDADAHEWSTWENIGGFATTDPSAVRTIEDGDEILRVFVRGPADKLFVNSFDGGWTDWQDLDVTFGGNPGCTDILVFGAHCYDTSGGSADQYSDLTRETGASIFVDHLGGAIEKKASGVATGNAGNTLRIFVHGPGHRLWFKKWNGGWQDWKQLAVTVNSAPGCTIKKSGGDAWCASVESDGTVKMILIDNSEM